VPSCCAQVRADFLAADLDAVTLVTPAELRMKEDAPDGFRVGWPFQARDPGVDILRRRALLVEGLLQNTGSQVRARGFRTRQALNLLALRRAEAGLVQCAERLLS